MNHKLQIVMEIIQQSEKLDAEQKANLTKTIKDADKELEITAFKLERTEKVKKTTAILLEQTIEELEQKRKAVEAQNRELEIEASLEKVRSIAMGMRKPADMLDVCKTISHQLESLGVKEIRNVQTAIFYEQRGTYMNYEYYAKHDKTFITETTYTNNEIHNEFATKMLKGKGENFITYIKGDEVKDWIEYQKTTNVFIDKYLETASSLNYYWFSLGPVALGISTYIPLAEDDINLFKRFLKVFELAFQRYLDIEKAEAQAREAEIELALERVRARTMAMQKSEELKEVIQVVYKQFVHLKINVDHAGFVVDYIPKGDWHFWIADQQEIPSKITHPYFDSVWAQQFNEAKEKGIDFFATNLNFEEKNKFYQELLSYVPDLPEASRDFYLSCPGLAATTVLFNNVSLYIENFSGTPYSDEDNKILMRFGKVFQQTYTRFLDLQKAEAQAREAQIEAALERVRSRTMAMHESIELAETAAILFKQMKNLGITPVRSYIGIFKEDTHEVEFWTTDEDGSLVSARFTGSIDEPTTLSKMYTAWKSQKRSLTIEQHGKELAEYIRYLSEVLNAPFSKEISHIHRVQSIAYFSKGLIGIATLDLQPPETINLLERFSGVFDLTYTRFLDLQKAEAQAREAQIEVALERIRARAMAMHISGELMEVANVLREQMGLLNQPDLETSAVLIYHDDLESWDSWYAFRPTRESAGRIRNGTATFSKDDCTLTQEIVQHFRSPVTDYTLEISGEKREEWLTVLMKAAPEIAENAVSNETQNYDTTYFHFSDYQGGSLLTVSYLPPSGESRSLQRRAASVFDLAYRRFRDLQKAEAQAREAKIEAALERVRSRTMAMQKSDELLEVVDRIFIALDQLGYNPVDCTIFTLDYQSKLINCWSSLPTEKGLSTFDYSLPFKNHPMINEILKYHQENKSFLIYHLKDEEKVSYDNIFFEAVRIPEMEEVLRSIKEIYVNCIFMTQGAVVAFTPNSMNENDINLLQRFSKVVDLTYTRFLDLQKAEAQAREAKIEVSLERVRSKAMAMHSPNDLSDTVNVFFKELKTLGIIPIRCGVGQIDETTRTTSLTTTTSSQQGESFQVIGKIKQTGHPVLDGIFDHWKLQKEYHPVLQGEDIKAYYNVMNAQIGYPDYPQSVTQYGNCFYFTEGFVFAWTENKLSEEELQIFRRFTSVLSLTYRRFLDLKEAEARAIEAVRQASLDRVRAEIASMRTAEDLNHITPIIWRELKILEVPFTRCGVFIVDDDQAKVQVYLSTPDGKSLGVLSLPIEFSSLTSNSVDYWRKKKVYKEHWSKEQFIKWTKSMIELRQIQNAETYQGSGNPPDSLDLHFVPFAQGMLYVGSISPLTEEKLLLVQTLAEAFSIAYARYEDFRNIEDAKNRIEVTLKELKSAQAQLIHSEKMASLGELTAGIAHEIKNPLNFVNNFSDLSRELLDDLKEELVNDNKEEVMAIVNDVKQNLEKINQHGKRADSIVKGMLLHSRGTSGEKVLTNINDLLEQYVTLAYHGMRAQNKEFNITIEKDYDKTLEKLKVVPQDISRVFLNLINNACYAANEKKQKSGIEFAPLLTVSTKKLQDKVEIKIRDNGNGIPAEIRDKLFNPFFTTKPTGEGTGLGLSLSYDIVVKQHAGEIKFESEEGKYTEFIIILPKQ